MPNYCSYSMKVKGTPENVQEFVNIIQVNYLYQEDGTCVDFKTKEPIERHLWRVFEADIFDDEIIDDIRSVTITGCCAWSVYSCMCAGRSTYQNDNPNKNGTTLENESARLNLSIEVFSEEPGCCFMEHYVYVNGKEIIGDCVDWNEYYVGDFETVEELNAEYNTNFTQEEFESDEYLHIGGMEWIFDEWERWEDDI